MNSLFSRDLCAALVLSFGHFLWIGTLIAVVAAVAVRRRRSAEARYRVWLVALIAMAASPFVTLAVLQSLPTAAPVVVETEPSAAEIPPAQQSETGKDLAADERLANSSPLMNETIPAEGLHRDSKLPGDAVAAAKELARPIDAPRESVWWRDYAPLVTSLYLIGVALMGLRLSLGLWGGRRLRNQATLITERSLLDALQRQADALGMKFAPALAYCERVTVPTVLGLWKPMILLPVSLASGLTPDQIESVLAHELAHLRRCDHLVNLMQCVIESVLFFHPAVWWVSRRIRDEREHCCDDLVIACGAVPLDYAASLLRVAELSREAEQQRGRNQRQSFTAASLFATGARPSTLRQRIARLLGDSTDTHVRFQNRWPVIFLCVTCLLLASVALQLGIHTSAENPPQRPDKYIAELPDGVTVELVGVTYHTSTSEPEPGWWTPGGSPLAPGRVKQNRLRGKSAPENHRIFVVETRGVSKDADVRVAISAPQKHGGFFSWGGIYVGRTPDPTIFTTAGPFVNAKQTTVRARLAIDDWGPVQEVSTSATRINKLELKPEYARCYGNIGSLRVDEHQSQAALTIGWPRNHDDLAAYEVWAVDKDGQRHEVNGSAGSREFSFKLPLSQIARFEYRLRPYRHWVTFENVSLQPGQPTDVKVTTAPPPLPRPNKYIAELPDRLKVEFVGLAEMGKEDQNWWKPDGVPLDQVPAHHQFDTTTTLGDQEVRRALIRVHGAKSYLDVTTNMTGSRADEATGSGGPFVSFDGALGFTRPQTTARVEVGVATQPLSPVRMLDASGKRLPRDPDAPADPISEDIQIVSVAHPRLRILGDKRVNGKPVPLTPDEESENDKRRTQTEIIFLPSIRLNRLNFQLTLIDIDGKSHGSQSQSFHFQKPDVAYTFDVPLERVARFEYRLRPYRHWVTFENVSLEPEQMTDTKVSVETVSREQPRAEREAATGAGTVVSPDGKPVAEPKPSTEDKKTEATSPPNGLEFLKPYPKLHGLSLDMTEPQFLEIVKRQELKTRKTVDGGKVTHYIGLGDGHTLIVMFDKDAKCRGIQRVRGEDEKQDVKPASAVSAKAIYHAEPEHLWNRMHEAFFVRRGPDAREYGRDRLEPLLWSESKHLLEPQSHQKAMGVLTEFLANNGERLINEPLKRAMMQRDLWLVFNWAEGAAHGRFAGAPLDQAEAKEAVRRLRTALATAIRRLELEPQVIQNLPDNYAAAVANGQFAKGFDPQKRERPFLPPDLFDPNGPWACIGRIDDRTAPQHLRGENPFTNSVFSVFVRLPNGRAGIADYLKELPAFPQGTQLALVRRAMLIDTGHRVVASNVIESVQLRVIGATRADESFFEFRLSRPNLFSAKAGGLIASTKTDSDLKTGFLVHSFDPMESTNEAAGRPFPGAHVQPLLRCTSCHEPKRAEFQSARGLDRTPQNFPLAEMRLSDVTKHTISWKAMTPEWRALQSLLADPDANRADAQAELGNRKPRKQIVRLLMEATGDPVRDADVVVSERRSNASGHSNVFPFDHWPADSKSAVVSNAKGEVAVAVDGSSWARLDLFPKWPNGDRNSVASIGRLLERSHGQPDDFHPIKLPELRIVSGRVVRPDGQPAESVRMIGYTRYKNSLWFIHSQTGTDGTFRVFIPASRNWTYQLWAVPDAFCPLGITLGGRDDHGTLTLKDGVRPRGRVVDLDGAPLAGIQVRAMLSDKQPGLDDKHTSSGANAYRRAAVTQADGSFELAPVERGTYQVTFADMTASSSKPRALKGILTARSIVLDAVPQEFRAVPAVELRVLNMDSQGRPRKTLPFRVLGNVADGRTNEINHIVTCDSREDGLCVARLPQGLRRMEFTANEDPRLSFRVTESTVQLDRGDGIYSSGRLGLPNGTSLDRDFEIELTWYAAPQLVVKVVDQSKVVTDADVTLNYGGQPGKRSDVEFDFRNGLAYSESLLPDETFTVTADKGDRFASQSLKLAEGEQHELVLVLQARGEKQKELPAEPAAGREGVIEQVADKAIAFDDGKLITTDAATKYARLTDKGEAPAERKELKPGLRVRYELAPGKGATTVVILPVKKDGE